MTATGAVPTGNTVVVVASMRGASTITLTSVTDSRGNTYTVDGSYRHTSQSLNTFVASGYITTPLATSDTITATFNTSGSGVKLIGAAEFAGLAQSGRLDRVAANASGSGTAVTSAASGATAQASELLVGIAGNGATVTPGPFTPASGWTTFASRGGGSGSQQQRLGGAWKTVSSVGSYTFAGSIQTGGWGGGSGTQYWTAGLVSYRLQATDTMAPSAPASVSASGSAGKVHVSWSQSPGSDNVGIARTQVHRSATSGFTPSPATLIGTTSLLYYVDHDVPAGSWYYKLVAVDYAGNSSPPSPANTTAATVSTATLPTVTLTAPADGHTVGGTVTLTATAAGGGSSLGLDDDPGDQPARPHPRRHHHPVSAPRARRDHR